MTLNLILRTESRKENLTLACHNLQQDVMTEKKRRKKEGVFQNPSVQAKISSHCKLPSFFSITYVLVTLFPKLLLLLELKIFTTHAKALISKTNTRKILANMKVVRSGTEEILAPCELMLLLLKKSLLFRLRTPWVCAKSKQQIKRGHRATNAQWSSGYAFKKEWDNV